MDGLADNEANINWHCIGPFGETEQGIRGDNLLHLAANTGKVDEFLSVFKKSVESSVRLLEYNKDHENPFHIAAEVGILPSVVKGIFKHLESEKTSPNCDPKKLENVKNYVKEALCDRCALDQSNRTPLDRVSKTIRVKLRKSERKIDGEKEKIGYKSS